MSILDDTTEPADYVSHVVIRFRLSLLHGALGSGTRNGRQLLGRSGRQWRTKNSVEIAVSRRRFFGHRRLLVGRGELYGLGHRLGHDHRGTQRGDLDAKLLLRLRRTVKLFVDGTVVALQADVVGGTIGVTLEHNIGIRWDVQQLMELGMGT